MITFPKTITIDMCEQFIEQLVTSGEKETLELPVDTTGFAFGGLASAIQAVNTWSRNSIERSVVARASQSKDISEEIINRPHKFVAAMYARSLKFSDDLEIDRRAEINTSAKKAIEEQSISKFGQQRGGLCWFAFVDHSSKGFDRNFYIESGSEKPQPRKPAQIQSVVSSMIEKSMSVSGGAKPIDTDDQSNIERMFYELFINTHEHGTRDKFRSDWLKPGVRVVYAQGINLTEVAAIRMVDKQDILAAYLDDVDRKKGGNSQKRFVEISIVDAGLGYCRRWLNDRSDSDAEKELNISEEYKIFRKCFSFRMTSTSQIIKGNGLPVVMDRLTKLGGFMRVRSGKLSLYRNFITSPFSNEDDCEFSDWKSGKSAAEHLTPMSPVSGVAITLLVPLEAKE